MQFCGLERLIYVLREHRIEMASRPPPAAPPHAGEPTLGGPFDPFLAEFYRRFNGGLFGDLSIFSIDNSMHGLAGPNAWIRSGEEERIRKLFHFGAISGFAYYLATIPVLAGPDGIQPVVYLDNYDDKPILPIASNVDRAFDLYAHYCAIRLKVYGALDRGSQTIPLIHFPEDLLAQITQDKPLVQMLAEGKFEEFVSPTPDGREWVEEVLTAARASP